MRTTISTCLRDTHLSRSHARSRYPFMQRQRQRWASYERPAIRGVATNLYLTE